MVGKEEANLSIVGINDTRSFQQSPPVLALFFGFFPPHSTLVSNNKNPIS